MIIVYWRTDTGHEHSFLAVNEVNWRQEHKMSPPPYDDIKNQGEYQAYILGKEGGNVEIEKEYPFTNKGIYEAIKDGAVHIDDDPDDIEFLVVYAKEYGLGFI